MQSNNYYFLPFFLPSALGFASASFVAVAVPFASAAAGAGFLSSVFAPPPFLSTNIYDTYVDIQLTTTFCWHFHNICSNTTNCCSTDQLTLTDFSLFLSKLLLTIVVIHFRSTDIGGVTLTRLIYSIYSGKFENKA